MEAQHRPAALLVSVLLCLTGCANGYRQFYRPVDGLTPETLADRRISPPPAVPTIERAQPGNGDAISDAYSKRGFILIGQSLFNSGTNEPEAAAVKQGQEVGADLVLILNPRYTGSVTSAVPLTTPTTTTSRSTGTATAYGAGGSVTAYGSGSTTTYGTTTTYIPMTIHRTDYGAAYFVKQRFGLGVFIRDLNDTERQELQSNKGVVIRLVVDDTPAFDADLLVGDVILAIDSLSVSNESAFGELLQERRGKRIAITISRRGQRLEKLVSLNR